MEISSTDTFPLPIFPCFSFFSSLSLSFASLPLLPSDLSLLRLVIPSFWSRSSVPPLFQRVCYAPCSSAIWAILMISMGCLAAHLSLPFSPRSDCKTIINMSSTNFCCYTETSCRFWACAKAWSWTHASLSTAFFPLLKFNGTLQLTRLRTLKLPLAKQSRFQKRNSSNLRRWIKHRAIVF